MGGMIIGTRRELWNKSEGIDVSRERLILGRIKEGRRIWRIVGVYVKENMRKMLQELERWVGEKKGEVETIIARDRRGKRWSGQ